MVNTYYCQKYPSIYVSNKITGKSSNNFFSSITKKTLFKLTSFTSPLIQARKSFNVHKQTLAGADRLTFIDNMSKLENIFNVSALLVSQHKWCVNNKALYSSHSIHDLVNQ